MVGADRRQRQGEAAVLRSRQDSDLHWSPDGTSLAFVSDATITASSASIATTRRRIEFLAPTTSQDLVPRWSPDGRTHRIRPHYTATAARRSTRSMWNPVHGRSGLPTRRRRARIALAEPRHAARLVSAERRRTGSRMGGRQPPGLQERSRQLAASLRGIRRTAERETADARRLHGRGRRHCAGSRSRSCTRANTGSAPGDDDRRHLFRVTRGAVRSRNGRQQREQRDESRHAGRTATSRSSCRAAAAAARDAACETARNAALDAEPATGRFPIVAARAPRRRHLPRARTDGWFRVSSSPPQRRRQASRRHLRPRRAAAPDAADVALHGLLLNAYAMNQYFASHGFVVLVAQLPARHRLRPRLQLSRRTGDRPAPRSIRTCVAGASLLQHEPQVDPKRIGIWGGSYGGYLTALALARNSDIFKAGVDFHGVHDWSMFDDPTGSASSWSATRCTT